jgi:hypothetical protein
MNNQVKNTPFAETKLAQIHEHEQMILKQQKDKYLKDKEYLGAVVSMLAEKHNYHDPLSIVNTAEQAKGYGYRYYIANNSTTVEDMGALRFPVRFTPTDSFKKAMVIKIGVHPNVFKAVMGMLKNDVPTGVLVMKRQRQTQKVDNNTPKAK